MKTTEEMCKIGVAAIVPSRIYGFLYADMRVALEAVLPLIVEECAQEAKILREALEEALGELVNLLPHIPQACIPGHEGFIDAHVDAAVTAIRAALAKTQEPT